MVVSLLRATLFNVSLITNYIDSLLDVRKYFLIIQ